jgi:hypothetical protein
MTKFTDAQLNNLGVLPALGDLDEVLAAAESSDIEGFLAYDDAVMEIKKLKLAGFWSGSDFKWRFYRGNALGICGYNVHKALVCHMLLNNPSAKVYRIDFLGLRDLMHIIHCWRMHKVDLGAVDKSLREYRLYDEVPFEVFRDAVDSVWVNKADKLRLVFQSVRGEPTSLYGTEIPWASDLRDALITSIELSLYETICLHLIEKMKDTTKNLMIIGIGDEGCYVYDATGRNMRRVQELSKMVWEPKFFARKLRFDGDIIELKERV